MLDRATFNKWGFDGTPQDKPCKIHIILLFNRPPDDSNTFRRHIQGSLKAFNPKAQVWKSKLQIFPDPSMVGFIMYSTNTLQLNPLVKNVLSVVKQKQNLNIEVEIQSEVAFLKNEDNIILLVL